MNYYKITLTVPDDGSSDHPFMWDWNELVGIGTIVESVEVVKDTKVTALRVALGNAGLGMPDDHVAALADALTYIGADFSE